MEKIQNKLNQRYDAGLTVDGVFGSTTHAALVKGLQTELNRQFGRGLTVDGMFGPATQGAVMAFQRLFGLTPDGIIGPLTWAKIVEVYNRVLGGVTTPPVPPPYPGSPLRVGSSGPNVVTLQQNLNRIAAVNSAIPKVGTDGIFGPLTEASVRAFQRYYGLTPDGIVGPATWNRLMQLEV